MKTIDYYMSLPYKMEIIPESDGTFLLSFPEASGVSVMWKNHKRVYVRDVLPQERITIRDSTRRNASA